MINTHLSVSVENNFLEPFEDRIDTLFRELELATKWQRPSVLWAIYSSEYVRADADTALESRLNLANGQVLSPRLQKSFDMERVPSPPMQMSAESPWRS